MAVVCRNNDKVIISDSSLLNRQLDFDFLKKIKELKAKLSIKMIKPQGLIIFKLLYQALYGSYGMYVRPLSDFVKKVEEGRIDNVTGQVYRFELYDSAK